MFLGESDPASSYLNFDKIIAAARETGAEAIHPGYGFLAENPAFAERVASEDLVFIGPPAEVMAKLGNKTTARRLMMEHQVPIIPGMSTAAADNSRLSAAADELGYPVIVKAAAGGGGKGMRIVESRDALAEAAETAASEALASFGDGSIYLEKYLDKPRHVEFQILADAHGNVVHLFERECSIQRRHQKIIEETPSVALTDDLRDRMGAAAVAAARAAGYVNAGTVEFLLDGSGEFYFLEVNTTAPGRAPHHGTDHRTRSGSPSNRDCRWAAFAFYPGGRQPSGACHRVPHIRGGSCMQLYARAGPDPLCQGAGRAGSSL